MRPYIAQLRINLKLTARDRMVLFFNYAFPLIFFFFFGQMMHAEQGGAIVMVVTMVLTIGVLGNGFFGAGIRAAQDREQNILRRFKVAPISPAPILVSSLITGLLSYLPSVILIILLAHFVYGMQMPQRLPELLSFLSLGILAFRAIGLIIASVVNSMQESQILVQILYMPMLLLSIMPLSELPAWAQSVAQFIPAAYLQTGLQGILVRNEGLVQNASPASALALTVALGLLLSTKLFRWEKEEKMRPAAKLWIAGVLAPFFVLGIYQTHSREALAKARVLGRDLMRNRNLLIRNARIYVGDGTVVANGSVLVKGGKIERVYEGPAPEPASLKAEALESSGKTVFPGLIDVHVHLAASEGLSDARPDAGKLEASISRELDSYLYCGVMAVKSAGDPVDLILRVRKTVNSGERLGSELFASGPMFTAAGGHGTEYFKNLPPAMRKAAEEQTVRTPATPDEARKQVRDLKARGLEGIKVILEAGHAGMLFNRMDLSVLHAIVETAHAEGLPVVAHTGDSRDVADAIDAGVNGIEHGSYRDTIPDALFLRMKAAGITYDPTLSVVDGFLALANGSMEPLERPLVLQTAPAQLIQSTRKYLQSARGEQMRQTVRSYGLDIDQGRRNLVRTWQSGVMLVTGTDSGNPFVFHGPGIHRELQLWVDAGIPAAAALTAATHNAAKLLRADDRIGLIKAGYEANLVIVDGDPLKDIKQTQSIQQLIFKGERIHRTGLFDQEQ